MAQWSRDPRMRKNLAWTLAISEALVLASNFYPVFWGGIRSVGPRVGFEPEPGTVVLIALAGTVVCLAAAMFQAIKYVRGSSWPRLLFIAENLLVIAGGVIWFYFTQRSHSDVRPLATGFGLMVPVATLFPLLWPLITFRPVPPPAPPAAAADQPYQY